MEAYKKNVACPPNASFVPAFSPMIGSGSDYLAGLPPPQRVVMGTILLRQQELPKFVGMVRSGIVKLTFANEDGQEMLLGLRSEGWWLNATLALLQLPSLCTVSTLTDCLISNLSALEFCANLPRDPQMLKHFLAAQSRELLMTQQHSIMRGGTAAERLRYLQGEGSHSIWKTVDPTLVMRQSEIAELLSITPEHLSRLMNHRLPERRASKRKGEHT